MRRHAGSAGGLLHIHVGERRDADEAAAGRPLTWPGDPAARPFLDAQGNLVLPTNAPKRFRYWQGGQSLAETMKYLLIFGLMLLLSGCLATDPTQWGPPQPRTVERDIYECEEDAKGKLAWAAGFGGAIVPLVGLFTVSREFERCMKARGYTRAE